VSSGLETDVFPAGRKLSNPLLAVNHPPAGRQVRNAAQIFIDPAETGWIEVLAEIWAG
jgi:hypothetical protein